MKKKFMVSFWMIMAVAVLWISPAVAGEYMVLDKPLTLLGYVTQGVAYGLNDEYDTKHGIQSALMNLFLEGQYRIHPQFNLYASGRFSADWAYPINNGQKDWNNRLFDQSSNRMYLDNNYWQILNEAHFTWTPGNFFFRVGKQIVSWGEMDGFRIMDQINPLDSRRGFADVEFENTLIPIWLIRSEFYPRIGTSWLQDLGLELVFNPNADFIPNQDILIGNADAGIWAPNLRFADPTAPHGFVRLGRAAGYNIGKPDNWNSDGYEYALRLKGVVHDAIITLNYFYGLDNSPVLKTAAIDPVINIASDGVVLVSPFLEGRFFPLKFFGLTASRDIPFLKATALGGVAPVLRLESFYGFSSTFLTPNNDFGSSDEVRAGLGIDWKIKIPLINEKAGITISPQLYYRRLTNLPVGAKWTDSGNTLLEEDNWQSTLFISTPYLNAKLVPSFFWLRDYTGEANFYRLQMTYDWSSAWRGTLGAFFINGQQQNNSFEAFGNKNYLYFKVTYKF